MSVLSDLLLQFIFPVIDGDGVIMSVKSMNQRLKAKCKECVSPHIIIMTKLCTTLQGRLYCAYRLVTNKSYLNGRLVQMSQVGCGLSGFMPQHHHVGIDQPERIDNHLKETAGQKSFSCLPG